MEDDRKTLVWLRDENGKTMPESRRLALRLLGPKSIRIGPLPDTVSGPIYLSLIGVHSVDGRPVPLAESGCRVVGAR
jgi:hypothetical protein